MTRVEFRELLRKTNDKKLNFEGTKREKIVDSQLKTFEIAVSRSVMLREKPAILRMTKEVEFCLHKGDGFQMSQK